MLKQPLLLRLLKSRCVTQPVAETAQSATAMTSAAKTEKVAANIASSNSAYSDSASSASLDSASSQANGSDADESQSSEPKAKSKSTQSWTERAKSTRWFTPRTISISFGILSALTGFAFTQDWSTSLQTRLQLDPARTPIRKVGDPAAESIERVADLFLTHQIFYRKLEAVGRAAIAPDSTTKPGASTAAASSATASLKPTSVPNVEKVTAAAPPVPAATPVAFSGTTIDSVLEMRVALAKDVDAIAFATSHGGTLTDLDGNSLKTLTPETASFASIGGGIVVDGETMPSAFWVYPDEGGYVAVGSNWYRGRVLIAQRERGLIAVNYVLLGDYLYSVVGSEMSSSWSIESLKAQAVAARSYALTHNIRPASEAYFDLDNTQRFQAYKGIDREDSITQAAVLATAGEFISHQGGIVESLYAASQEIVDDAHKGSGMSQLGAKDLAEQGYSYQEILVHYYPGTALGRIETEHD